jgi:hypothetical protein
MVTGKGTSNLAETANIEIRMRTSATGRRRARWAAVRESPNTVTATIKNGEIAKYIQVFRHISPIVAMWDVSRKSLSMTVTRRRGYRPRPRCWTLESHTSLTEPD